MSPATHEETQSLERFRSYLHVVARLRLRGEQQKRIDPSAIVRQTLQEASRQGEHRHERTPAETAMWLRKLLAHNLGAAFRTLHQADADNWRVPGVGAGKFAGRSPAAAVAEGAPAATTVETHDPAIALAEALVQLPDDQREAILLQYWHGMTLAEIGARIDRTPVAVAGLLKRGLARLRQLHEGSP
jgi:RNA polymerase sigma-70 factor (ECF subfamily)